MLVAVLCAVFTGTAWGAESVCYTLTPTSGSNNGYANDCDIAIDGITWNLTGNSQQIPWRIGGKSLSNVDRTLYSKTAIIDNVSKIEVTHGAASSITVNSWTVIVASNADFTNIVSTLTPTFGANTTTIITKPAGVDWSNCYYKFVYNVTVSGSSNRYLEFSEAKFYSETSSTLDESDLAITGAPLELSFDLYNNKEAQTVIFTTSSTGAVTVSESEYVTTRVDETSKTITVTPKKKTSSQTITVLQAADDTYAAGSATFTVTVDDSTPETAFSWVETSLSDLTADDVFVIVGNNYVLPHDKGTSEAPGLVPVTISESKITSSVTDIIKWNVSGNATDGYTFYPYENQECWLYCNTTAGSSSNNNIRIGVGPRKVFVLTSNNYLKTKDNYTSRYLSIYGTQDWRGYTSADNAPVIKFYKLTNASATSISASDVNLAFNATSGSFNYTITNPIDGTLLTASTEASWISDVTVGTDS